MVALICSKTVSSFAKCDEMWHDIHLSHFPSSKKVELYILLYLLNCILNSYKSFLNIYSVVTVWRHKPCDLPFWWQTHFFCWFLTLQNLCIFIFKVIFLLFLVIIFIKKTHNFVLYQIYVLGVPYCNVYNSGNKWINKLEFDLIPSNLYRI